MTEKTGLNLGLANAINNMFPAAGVQDIQEYGNCQAISVNYNLTPLSYEPTGHIDLNKPCPVKFVMRDIQGNILQEQIVTMTLGQAMAGYIID